MKSSRRLVPVARVARQHERNAARELGNTLRENEQQQKQLDDLVNYRDQYVAGFQAAGKEGLTAVQLRDYQLFLNRLDTAIMQQQQKLAACRQDCEQSQAEWHDKNGHSKMIDKVVENRKKVEDRQLNDREQREQDDRPNDSMNGENPDS
jgi:flagellar FliJ protein